MTCCECKFYLSYVHDFTCPILGKRTFEGICRRYPVVEHKNGTHWCGEIKSKAKPKAVKKTEPKKEVHIELVLLTKDEYQKLKDKFGDNNANNKIESLNEYIGSTGKKYKSHYHTILMWARKDIAGKPEVKSTADTNLAQWESQCGNWLRQSDKEAIQKHGSFMQRLINPAFRAWAESVNVIVKEI